jgi:D-alanyl-D-alanine carboxypeptidase
MQTWLPAALGYIPQWLHYQVRQSEQPGCVIAIAEKGRIVLEQAFGVADIASGTALSPRHRFRVASHSKSFTAAGILKLREQGRLRLDDRVGEHIGGLHRTVARATIAQLLSHTAGITRDGPDGGHWQDRHPFLNPAQLRANLAAAPVIAANTRFKYSNLGYGLLGLVIEAVTDRPYREWIRGTIIDPAGLRETDPDMPVGHNVPLARGHGAKLPMGHRVVIPGDNPTDALASASGFVSTAADLARFFAQLDPAVGSSILSVASRREMVHPLWRYPQASLERSYGLGIIGGRTAEWDWFGHNGAFQGFITTTAVLSGRGLTVSLLTNAVDGPANAWLEGIVHILATFAGYGAPVGRVRDWTGRWWNIWGAVDLVPMGRKVMVASPGQLKPFQDSAQLSVVARDRGRIGVSTGLAAHGEGVKRVRGGDGEIDEVWLGAVRYLPETSFAAELEQRYGG